MQKHDTPARRDPGRARGLLSHPATTGSFQHTRIAPDPAIADLVQHYWIVRWNLEGLPPQRRETLPHPNVHLVLQTGNSRIHGIHTGRFTRTLAGRDGVFGIKFRAGGFRPFLGGPVSDLRDRCVWPDEIFGTDAIALENGVIAQETDQAMTEFTDQFFINRRPVPDKDVVLAGRIVDHIADNRDINRVEQVQDTFGLHARTLQRLFHDYVGIGAKWVINRFRLHEAVERLSEDQPIDWAQLALDLGYFDQAHFIRDFKAMTGRSPARYLREQLTQCP